MQPPVEFFTGADKDAYWRVVDSHGNIINRSSEGFRQIGASKNNLLIFHTLLSTDLISLYHNKDCSSLSFYVDEENKQRWRVKAGNGEIVGAAHIGFKNIDEAKNNVLMIYALISTYIASIAMEK